MVPLNAALRKNRLRITDGRPAAIRSVPGGSSRGVTTSSPMMPRTAAPVSHENSRTWSYVPSWSSPAARATRTPAPAVRRCEARSLGSLSVSPVRAIARRWLRIMARVSRAGGTTTQNTSRHVKAVVSQPDSGAPISDGSTQAAETQANTLGRSSVG